MLSRSMNGQKDGDPLARSRKATNRKQPMEVCLLGVNESIGVYLQICWANNDASY